MPIQTFDQGLSKGLYAYVSDDGNTYLVSMRKAYETASGLTLSTAGAFPLFPRGAKPRRIHLHAVNGTEALSRSFPCSAAQVQALNSGGNITIDGVAWIFGGFTGEKQRR